MTECSGWFSSEFVTFTGLAWQPQRGLKGSLDLTLLSWCCCWRMFFYRLEILEAITFQRSILASSVCFVQWQVAVTRQEGGFLTCQTVIERVLSACFISTFHATYKTTSHHYNNPSPSYWQSPFSYDCMVGDTSEDQRHIVSVIVAIWGTLPITCCSKVFPDCCHHL